MSDTRNNFSEDAAARRYRSAVETVDERPSAATRAAILAAAARQVGAQPQSADAPLQRPARRRWPLAAAAAILLSTLAVMMAVRTEREMPSFSAPAPETSNRVVQPIAPPAPPPAAAPPASGALSDLKAQVEAEQERKPTLPPAREVREERSFDSARRSATDRAATERPTAERSTTDGSTTDRAAVDAGDARAKLTKESGSTEPPPAAPKAAEAGASIARAPAPSLEAAAPAALGSAAGVGPRENDVAKRKDERDRQLAADAPRSSSPPSSAPMTPAAGRVEGKMELSAADWMKKIFELRAQGRDEEADLELRKFRERYPEVVVPPEALSRAATR